MNNRTESARQSYIENHEKSKPRVLLRAVPERAERTGFPFERERECVCVRGGLSLRGRPLAQGDRLIRGSRQ